MFTGIVEQLGIVKNSKQEGQNIHFEIEAGFTDELKIDQSIAHNGCCLTVVELKSKSFVVTAIQETLNKTNLGSWKVGCEINLERCMQINGRLDGHIVQGHVDTVGTCVSIGQNDGSWEFAFEYQSENVTVEKGSITINGVSLTVVNSKPNQFSVHIIPYTFENTNFRNIQLGDSVNLEFDIIGKYVARLMNK